MELCSNSSKISIYDVLDYLYMHERPQGGREGHRRVALLPAAVAHGLVGGAAAGHGGSMRQISSSFTRS